MEPNQNKITSPLKAIKQFCFECSGENVNEVKNCVSSKCPLRPFRMGKNPYNKREMTEEQKQAARERLMQYHQKKKESEE